MARPTQIADPSVEVGILCALELEAAPIVRQLGGRQKTIGSVFSVVRGTISRRRVAVVRSDAGRSRVAVAADALLTVHQPRWLIAAGFAVGVIDDVQRGQIVVAREVTNVDGEIFPADTKSAGAVDLAPNIKFGRLVSVPTAPRTVAEKRQLFAMTAAIAADQHSLALAKLCGERGVRFLSIRVLVDDATADAEPESKSVFHPSASYRAGGIVGAFLSGSGRAERVWKIRAAASRHATRLAEFLARLVPTLE